MAITKVKKKELVADLTSELKDAPSVVFVNFHGLSVAETTNLRKNLREQGVSYRVAKKTLLRRALETTKTSGEIPELGGEVAIAYGTDLLAPARESYNFEKTHKDSFRILGGIFEGKYLDQAGMLSIATIPPREVLLAQFVNLINSPIQRFAVA